MPYFFVKSPGVSGFSFCNFVDSRTFLKVVCCFTRSFPCFFFNFPVWTLGFSELRRVR